MAGFLLYTQAVALGSMSSLVQVGVDSRLAPYISGVLPDLHFVTGTGTDGQTYFAIANDLKGNFAPPLMASPGLRYSRIGFPWLASLGGILSGPAVLKGMLTVLVLSAAASAAALMGLAAHFGLNRGVAVGLFGNLGWFVGIRVLTPDPLGLALLLGGLLAAVHDRNKTAYALLVGAALTKEPYYAGALAVAIWSWQRQQRVQAAVTAILPAVAVAMSTAWVYARIGSVADAPNVAWPVVGIVKASSYWAGAPTKDQFYTGLAIVTIVLALTAGVVAKHTLLRWSAWGWAAIGLLGSDWIWFFGNSTARVLAPAWLFAFMGFYSARRRTADQLSESGDAMVDLGRTGHRIREA